MYIHSFSNFNTLEKGCKECPKGQWCVCAVSHGPIPTRCPALFHGMSRYNDQLGGSSLNACKECPRALTAPKAAKKTQAVASFAARAGGATRRAKQTRIVKSAQREASTTMRRWPQLSTTLCDRLQAVSQGHMQPFPGGNERLPRLPSGKFTEANENPHTELDFAKHDGLSKCKACGAGETYDSGSCVGCERGKFSGQDQVECEFCGAGMYADVQGLDTCKPCPVGYFRNGYSEMIANRGQACVQCPVGRFMDDAQGTYARAVLGAQGKSRRRLLHHRRCCLRGVLAGLFHCARRTQDVRPLCRGALHASRGRQHLLNMQRQHEREPGYLFWLRRKANIKGGITCTDCGPGKFAEGGDLPACKSCPAGFYRINGTRNRCVACVSGKWSDKQGPFATSIAICQSCGPGRSRRLEASSRTSLESGCLECRPGRFSIEESAGSASDCKECPKGKWASDEGRGVECIACAAGRFKHESGSQIDCTDCPAGYAQHNNASSLCAACLTGKSQAISGKMSCDDCELGTFSDVLAGETCKQCPRGFAQNQKGQSNCLPCFPGESARTNSECAPATNAIRASTWT